ncbi:MAG TPA: bifunctional [glutamate--ammonia ligase]-adenylyl-L-tyrosine phosphorylase/[glutamate--ammonia-ligase] adenylyltransferase [Fimbriiglobus sp.]|jgi:glutamate-ammonia-ligase adenylyltransferase
MYRLAARHTFIFMPALDLSSFGLRDPARGERILTALAETLGPVRFAALCGPLPALVARSADPDMALNNLERLLAVPMAREKLPSLLDAGARGLDMILTVLAASQFFADCLLSYPEAVEHVRTPPRRNPSTGELVAELRGAVDHAPDDAAVLREFRRFRKLHALRVGVNDVVRARPLEEITRDLARIADACVDVAVHYALATRIKKYGPPAAADGSPARIAALAFGKLGGDELNYSSDIDLMFVYDQDGMTAGKRTAPIANAEFFSRVVAEVVRVLSAHTDHGFAYRVDLRLRPEGNRGPLARSLASTLSYYDVTGRTWERQALIKLRPVAGDRDFGKEFVAAVEPFVYRKYFSYAEINEVKALKRRMEQHVTRAGLDDRDVKAGHGGIRDIEYTVQFLQLLNGGDLPAVRQRNTLLALDALEIAGCLTPQETYILADAYRFLRKTEHRLQLLFDWQTHRLPDSPDELRKLALRMGYTEQVRSSESKAGIDPTAMDTALRSPPAALAAQRRSPLDESPTPPFDTRLLLIDPLDLFLKDFQDKTALDRTILDHLLHQTFADAAERAEPEADLILQQDPDDATVQSVLGRYGFRDVPRAYRNLNQLARESVPFLSARRCRHFLASIAPQLLRAVADAPDPDEALNNLEQVTASLGAKAVLYELFSFNPATLKLYVDLCAGSSFLSGLLINNPGMVDELLDSLVLDQPRSAGELAAELAELTRGANDLDPILHSFQDKELLRIGVRDLLGKDTIAATTAALSDLADTLLNAVVDLQEPIVRDRYGSPTPGRYALLGLGKLGGREISYHSDLDLLLVYEADGRTIPAPGADPLAPFEATTAAHYFTELAQRTIRSLAQTGPLGRLYAVDMRLRPTGKSGALVLPLAEFERYFTTEDCQLWERQALTRARVVRGDPAFASRVGDAVRVAVLGAPVTAAVVADVQAMRDRLESSARPRSLKRGPGGIADVEFAVQLLQLKYGRLHPEILVPNIWDALNALATVGLLSSTDAAILRDGYTFLRFAEARVRIVTDQALTEVPENLDDREKLARRMGYEAGSGMTAADRLHAHGAQITAAVRAAFQSLLQREKGTAE